MTSLLSWIFSTSENTIADSTLHPTSPAIDVLIDNMKMINIQVDRKSNSTLVFKRKNDNEFFVVSIAPRWDAENKDVYPEWYVNELFYPQRRTIVDFVDWLVKLGIKASVQKYDNGRVSYFIEITNKDGLKVYILSDQNYSLRVEYFPPSNVFEQIKISK